MGELGREEDPRSIEELEREKLEADTVLAQTEARIADERQKVEVRKLYVEVAKAVITVIVACTTLLLALNSVGLIATGEWICSIQNRCLQRKRENGMASYLA